MHDHTPAITARTRPRAGSTEPSAMSLSVCLGSWELGFGTVAGLTVAVPTGNPTNASRGATAARAPPSTVPLASP
jgi:hypothetical protein